MSVMAWLRMASISARASWERLSKSVVCSRSSAISVLKWAQKNAPLPPNAAPIMAKSSIHRSTDRVKIGNRTERRAA